MSHRFSQGQLLVNRYEIGQFHLAGGMQEVYRCYDHTLQRNVALKTPKDGVVDRRFKRGAEMGARVNHPNIAATFDYFEDKGVGCLVEEFIEGEDLGGRLEREFFYLDPSLAAHVMHHIAKALQAAHKVGICHRDLKPSNIMTSADPNFGLIKLTDFGIAKLAEDEIAAEMELFEKDSATLTSSNTLLGAVPYMAPECWSDWSGAGQPMDIWAFGCIAFHVLSGSTPFGTGRAAIANVIRAEQTKSVKLDKPAWFGKHPSTSNLENGLWDIIQTCIQVDPKTRPNADVLVAVCDQLCYATSVRLRGLIEEYEVPYANGSKSKSGYIKDSNENNRWFFHVSEFFGESKPVVGQSVSYSVYPGTPRSRCSPVLHLRV